MGTLRDELRARLSVPARHLDAVNAVLLDVGSQPVNDMLDVVARYGTPEEINRQAAAARQLPALLKCVEKTRPEHLADLKWLAEARDRGAFVGVADYRRRVLGAEAGGLAFDEAHAVTLEISACQYFSWVIEAACWALEHGGLMPGRFIRVRKMKEQEADGDLPAFAAAMQIIGASCVEQPDTRGIDGSNIHLGGADTIIGYMGGVGQPNDYPLRWLDEYLYYYTHYGVREVLNLNPGTILLGCLLHRLGVDIEFKVSVIVGNDNPFSALWTLLTARLLARDDGSTSLAGLNWSNSTDNETIAIADRLRRALGFERQVRFEYHVTQTWGGIVVQPFIRRDELVDLAGRVGNISAKHEGGDPEVEQARERRSDIRDYYRDRAEIVAAGDWEPMTLNFIDKLEALNRTARALTEHGLAFVAAPRLHHQAARP
ncbi:MAG TPA: hypothetical protein PLJ35_13880 [Anaerolineae bacterium]|nr:hypothetical protein [Anaerolineae bacterium]